jgi:hypothetical protein
VWRRFSLLVVLALSACSGLPPDLKDAATDHASFEDAVDDVPPVPETVPVAAGVASWVLPRTSLTGERRAAFLAPWPSDLARDERRLVDLTFVPGAGTSTLVGQYIATFNHRLEGFSPVAATYFRFGSVIDPATLPRDAERSRRGDSSVQLIDIDPTSPDRGRRVPLQWYVRDTPTRWWHSNTLAVAPATGFPLRPRTRYAVVVTRDLRAMGGAAFMRDRDFDDVLSNKATSDDAVRAARVVFESALDAIEGVGVMRTSILTATVFTTLDPTADFFRAADWLRREGPTPRIVDQTVSRFGAGFNRINGHYGPNPVFQAGASPYAAMGSGGFVRNAEGVPQVQRTENIRFALTVPAVPMPERGYPIAIYAHGTGGDYQTFVTDTTAVAVSNEGVAMLGFDQVFHGERATMGTTPDVAFFNFLNPEAGRTNNIQAALDLVQCGRFVRDLRVNIRHTDGQTETVHFDPERVMFFGHSQGGLNGPLWLAGDDVPKTAVLSGAGGSFNVALLLKTRPVNVPQLITTILGLAPRELVSLHPVISLLQFLVDPSDPVNYARYIVREPRMGMSARHVFLTQGFVDTYTPPEGIAALARAMQLPIVSPTLHPDPLVALTGVAATVLPARNNVVLGEMRSVTGAWMQFDAPMGRDGHFVVFSVPGARLRAASFLGSAARDPAGVPTVPAMVP